MDVRIMKLVGQAEIPSYSNPGDAGLDLKSISKTYDEYGNTVYGTGLAIEIPKGYVGLLFPRSSVSKTLQSLANCVGVIDSGYRGEIIFKFKPTVQGHAYMEELFGSQYEVGDKIGQLIIMPYPYINLVESKELSQSQRDVGSFGSTGK